MPIRGLAATRGSRRAVVTGAVALLCLVVFLAERATLAAAGTPADLSFSNGVLTIAGFGGSNDKHVLRCRDGFVRVGSSQVPDDPVRCGQVREVVARPGDGSDGVNMSEVTREFGNGGPIKITIYGESGSDSLTGAPLHRNVLIGGADSDRISGGEIADRISGGAKGDILSGMGGGDFISGGTGGDLMYGDRGNDSLFGGPGNDALNGGPGRDKLVGGPGRDREAQGYSGGRR